MVKLLPKCIALQLPGAFTAKSGVHYNVLDYLGRSAVSQTLSELCAALKEVQHMAYARAALIAYDSMALMRLQHHACE